MAHAAQSYLRLRQPIGEQRTGTKRASKIAYHYYNYLLYIHIVLVVVAAVFVAAACEWICNNEWCKFDGAERQTQRETKSELMHTM